MRCTVCGFDDTTPQYAEYRRANTEWTLRYEQERIRQNDKPWRIWNYSYKPNPTFFGRSSDGLFFGIELELEAKADIAPAAFTKAVHESLATPDNMVPLLYYKSDGSLRHGAEIVTHPMSFTYFNKSFPEATKKILADYAQNFWVDQEDYYNPVTRKEELRDLRIEQCGLHIHMSRDAFGKEGVNKRGQRSRTPYHLYKFLQFIYGNKELVQKVAAREGCIIHGDEMCSYEKRRLGQATAYDHKSKQYVLSSDKAIQEIARGKMTPPNRYMAVNCALHTTVELRVFKATTNWKRVRAYVQFCDAAFYYTQTHKLHHRTRPELVMSQEGFIEYVLSRSVRYADLLAVLNDDPAYAA